METYKIGNKVKCTIRSLVPGILGSTEMQYGNQPYTILKDIDASMQFSTNSASAKTQRTTQLAYNVDNISGLRLSNVSLTKKVLDLIFDNKPKEELLCNESINIDVEPGKPLELTHLLNQHNEIYQVFIYDADGSMVAARGIINDSNFNDSENGGIIEVNEFGGNFLVFYSYEGQLGYSLKRENNTYVSIDLEVTGNESDDLNTYYIHLHRCSLGVNKHLYFNGNINNVDLEFVVVPSEEDYITIK